MKAISKYFLVLSMLVFAAACSDSEIDEPITAEDVENLASIDEATNNYLEIVSVATDILDDESLPGGRINSCYSLSETQNQNEVRATFEGECEGEDGKIRSGSLLVSWTADANENILSYTVTFEQYTVDGYIPEGSVTVTTGTISQTSISFSVVVNDGQLTCPDGKQLSYEQDLTYALQFETFGFTLDGSVTGTNKDGVTYIGNISSPLTAVLDCEYLVSGRLNATFNGRQAVTLDYGDGTCDNLATLSRGSESLTIEL